MPLLLLYALAFLNIFIVSIIFVGGRRRRLRAAEPAQERNNALRGAATALFNARIAARRRLRIQTARTRSPVSLGSNLILNPAVQSGQVSPVERAHRLKHPVSTIFATPDAGDWRAQVDEIRWFLQLNTGQWPPPHLTSMLGHRFALRQLSRVQNEEIQQFQSGGKLLAEVVDNIFSYLQPPCVKFADIQRGQLFRMWHAETKQFLTAMVQRLPIPPSTTTPDASTAATTTLDENAEPDAGAAASQEAQQDNPSDETHNFDEASEELLLEEEPACELCRDGDAAPGHAACCQPLHCINAPRYAARRAASGPASLPGAASQRRTGYLAADLRQ